MTRWNALKATLGDFQDNVIAQSAPRVKTVGAVVERVSINVKRASPIPYDGYHTDTNTIIIVISVVIPCVFVIFMLLLLHRRHVRMQRLEKNNDKNDTLDYGFNGMAGYGKRGKRGAKARASVHNMDEKDMNDRGVSFDMTHPYILPAALKDSRESFTSLSRSTHDLDDPYRPSMLMMADQLSIRPYTASSISRFDNASIRSGFSSSTTGKRALLQHSQRPSKSTPQSPSVPESPESLPSLSPIISNEVLEPLPTPKRLQQPLPAVTRSPLTQIPVPNVSAPGSPLSPGFPSGRLVREGSDQKGAFVPAAQKLSVTVPPTVEISSPASTYSFAPAVHSPPTSPPAIHSPPSSPPAAFPARVEARRSAPPPPVPKRSSTRTPIIASIDAKIEGVSTEPYDEDATYADVLGIVQAPTTSSPPLYVNSPTMPSSGNQALYGLGVQGLQFENDPTSRLRPLPPNDPNENAEQRANRIRSFYREYFDETKNGRGRQPHGAQYYEDYDTEYLNEAPIFDPVSGQFIFAGANYAQPYSRRAMTPPPRAPPRFDRTPRNQGSVNSRGGRAHSSASDFRGRKPFVPPSPLMNLPTPHMLKDTTGAWSPIDFAPPQSYRDRRAGTPSSPRSVSRPYSPSTRAHTPLVSSFDDLAMIPSPHALRKSGTFTGIDFALPHRFRNGDLGARASETGSMHSMRSGLSTAHQQSIRAGAYRVSRIPKEFVGTRDDFAIALKPSWDQRG